MAFAILAKVALRASLLRISKPSREKFTVFALAKKLPYSGSGLHYNKIEDNCQQIRAKLISKQSVSQ